MKPRLYLIFALAFFIILVASLFLLNQKQNTGIIRACSYTLCGNCYCLEAADYPEEGCVQVEYSAVGDLAYAVNKTVIYEGDRESAGTICSRTCPCGIVLKSIRVIS